MDPATIIAVLQFLIASGQCIPAEVVDPRGVAIKAIVCPLGPAGQGV